MDVGMTGLNIARFGDRVTAASDLLDPATNLDLAAEVLAEGLRTTPKDPALAIGRVAYPADPNAARALGRQVLAIATALDGAPSSAAAPTIRCVGKQLVPAPRVPAVPADQPFVVHLIKTAAARHGVDPAFALAIAKNESGFRQSALSPKGARGVMQLMPGTASRYGADPRDLGQNIDAGVRYLRDLAELFGGDAALVAAAYNAGEHAVVKHGWRVPPYRETQAYVPRVLAAREQLWFQP
jgi:soluble lytic murein transglycosylase-like protein